MNGCDQKRSNLLPTIAFIGFMLVGASDGLMAQVALPALSFATPAAEGDDRTAKFSLALEAASVAAEAELFDLSFEAIKRLCAEGPPVAKPQIQSGLLGGQANTATRVISGRPGYQQPEGPLKYSLKLFNIVDKLKSKQAPPERIAEALEQIVFPAGRPNEILLFSSVPPANTNVYSYDFSFAKPKTARYLAFELIELAAKNKTLPSLMEKLEKLRAQPGSQSSAVTMLVYAHRVTGQTDEATQVLNDFVANPIDVESTMPLYHALIQVVPDVGEASIVPVAASSPILTKLLKQNVTRMDIRSAILQQLQRVIEAGDQAAFETYVAMIVESINQMPGAEQTTINYMLSNFYNNLVEECKRQGKAALAIDVSTRSVDAKTELGQASGLDFDTIASFAELQPDVRLKALRKMLIERPLIRFEQCGFANCPTTSNAPEFLRLASDSGKLTQLLPYEGAKVISLLDLLLNQMQSDTESKALVKELLANANENNDVKRFLAVWVNYRFEKRGRPNDAELEELAKFDDEKEYSEWWKSLPVPAATELLNQQLLSKSPSKPPSESLLAAFEDRFKNADYPTSSSVEIHYQRRLAADKSLLDANRLKHWIVSYEPINWQQVEELNPVWTINEKQQIESMGGALYSQLIFRYPLPTNSAIKLTANRSEGNRDGLYCGGATVLSFDEEQGMTYAMAPNVRVLGQFTAKSNNAPRNIEGSFKEKSLSLKMGDKAVEVLDFKANAVPFLGLASHGVKPAAFSEIKITSPSELPREVSMLDEGLTGWSAGLFRHALPKLAGRIEPDGSESTQNYMEGQAAPMWKVVDNELKVVKQPAHDEAAASTEETEDENDPYTSGVMPSIEDNQRTATQSAMTYSRPLCDGESVEYEFYYQPGKSNASPSIGRIAYLIGEDGKITLKWISTNIDPRKPLAETAYLGEDPAAEVLGQVKLEPDAWNRAQLRLEGGKVVLSVAGKDVYRRSFEQDTIARFGFYCNPQKDQVRIRNVLIKGDWPTELPKDLWELK